MNLLDWQTAKYFAAALEPVEAVQHFQSWQPERNEKVNTKRSNKNDNNNYEQKRR